MSLTVKVISAQLTRDTEMFSKMDPYCTVKLGGQNFRTKTRNEAGKKPVWNESFSFNTTNNQSNSLQVTVFDEDTVNDDKVGSGSVDILKYKSTPGERDQIVQLYFEGKAAGKVQLKISGSGSQGQQPNQYGNQQQNPYGNQQQNLYGNQQQNQQQNPYGNQQQNQYGNQQQNQYGNQQPNQNQYGNQQPNQYGNQQPNQAGGNNPWQGVVQPQFLNSLGNQPQQNNNFGQPPQQQQNAYGVQPNNQWGSPQNNAPNSNNANNNMYPTVPAYNGSGNPNTQQNTQGNSNQGQQMAFQLFGGMQGLMNQQQSNQNNPNKPY